ncbi:ABC transporter substrate-binding protein, partial [Halobacillus trueperi]
MRIVSICPSNTEIVANLGQTHLLVGVDNYSDYPEEVEHLPKLGPDLSIDIERVASLKPDLV